MIQDFILSILLKIWILQKNEADHSNLDLPVLNDVLKMFKTLQEKGYDDLGTQALIKYYQDS